MSWLLRAFLVIISLLTLSVAVLVYLVPSTALERHILAAASRATGTEITSAGTPEITLFPSIAMTLRDVTVKSRTPNQPSLTAKKVEAAVGWLPILTTWTVDISELRIFEPVLQVQSGPERTDAVITPQPAQPARRSYPAPGLAIGTVKIVDGAVTGLGENWRIKDIDAEADTLRLDQPIKISLYMFLNGEKVAGDIALKEPSAIAKKENIPVTAKFLATPGNLNLDGVASIGDKPAFKGRLQVGSNDLGASAKWLGTDAGTELDKKDARLDGQIAYLPGAVIFENSTVELAQMKANVGGRVELGGDTVALTSVEFGDFARLDDGAKTLLDLQQLRMTIDRIQSGAPLKAQFAFMHNGKPVSGSAQVPDLDMLLDGTKTPVVKAAATIPGGQLDFDGEIFGGGEKAIGMVSFAGDAPRETAAWLGVSLPDAQGYKSLQVEGDVVATSRTIVIKDSKFKLDRTSGSGDIAVVFSAERASLNGAVVMDAIDTAAYVEGSGPVATSMAVPAEDRRGAPAQLAASELDAPYQLDLEPVKTSLEAYLASGTGGPRRAAAVVSAPAPITLSDVWSTASLGVEALKSSKTDVIMDVSVGDYRHGAYELGKTSLIAKLTDGALDLNIREARPLDGRISGTLKVDATASQPAFQVDLTADQVPVEKVVSEAGRKREIVRGTLTGKAKLSAQGDSEADVVASLKGNVTGQVSNGAIVGYDIRRIVRPFASREYNPQHATPFESLKGAFEISSGIASSRNISLDGPGVRIRANGTANLKTTAIDYRSKLDLVPPPSNFSLPLKIRGTWKQISAAIDWARLASTWTGASPFEGLETSRRSRRSAPAPSPSVSASPPVSSGDKDLDQLLGELVSKGGGNSLPASASQLMREVTGQGR
jgi:uncharacterized protein involved in outer membrane biogenesis